MTDFGSGTDGELIFTTTTKSYGSLSAGVDYNVSGNTLYLFPDREYNFTNMTLGAGTITTLDPSAVNAAVLYIQCTGTATIDGSVRLDPEYTTINAGTTAATTWASPLGNITGPGVANGGAGSDGGTVQGTGVGGTGGAQANGFGGGGGGGAAYTHFGTTYGAADGGNGGAGGLGPSGGAGGYAYTTTITQNGGVGTNSGGGGGGACKYNTQAFWALGGSGAGSYGGSGGGATLQPHSNPTYPFAAGGGGGAGGYGKQGIHFYLIALVINFTGVINTSGGNGTNGGNGGSADYHNGDGGANAGGGGAGGGGGGGNAGNIKFNFGSVTDAGTKTMSAGTYGVGGTGASNGSAGSAGAYSSTVEIDTYAFSGSIDYNNGTITQAKLTGTSVGGFINYWMSADGGAHWEEVSSGVLHSFTYTGTDLRWKAGAVTGVVMTGLEILNYH